MDNRLGGTETICPFYLRNADKSITCEGLLEGTTSLHKFSSERDMQWFQIQNCFTHTYTTCDHARALEQKYCNDANSVNLQNVAAFPAKMRLGERISIVRHMRGLSQDQVAQVTHLSRSYIGDIELDRKNPSIDALKLIATALQIDPQHLIAEAHHD